MKNRDLLLAIDNGTQSIRALAIDTSGTILAKARVPFEPYFSKHHGWAEQDPAIYWNGLCTACQNLWREHGIAREAISGVVVTTQRGTVLNLDQQGEPLRPAITWLDQRTTKGLEPVRGAWGLLFKLARLNDTINYLLANAESNWIRTHQPEVWKKTHKFVLLSGYLSYKLTGEYRDSVGCQVAYLPFDYKKLRWAASRDWRWKALGITPDLLNDIVPPGQTLGHIHAKAAAQTGIPQGTPLIAGAADKACEVLGAGGLEPNTGSVSFGTTCTITSMNASYYEPLPFIPPYPAAIPGFYNPEIQVFRGFWMIEWFKREFGYQETLLAESSSQSAEAHLEQLLQSAQPGSRGLMLQPYWSPGLRLPGPEAKGAVIGWSDYHSRAHFYRSIMEGLAYALREGKERIEKRGKVPITNLRVSGGGSQSNTALQITADMFGLPAIRPNTYETSGLGAAIIGAVGLGLYPDFPSAVKNMTGTRETFEPIPDNHRLYSELYQRVYLKMYKSLQPLYRELKTIMNY